jgi:hypothetical protein
MPLFDAYAGQNRPSTNNDARLNPILKPGLGLPQSILCIVPAIDVLAAEQISFIERVNQDLESEGSGKGRKAGRQWCLRNGFMDGWSVCGHGTQRPMDKRELISFAVPTRLFDNKDDRERAFEAPKHSSNCRNTPGQRSNRLLSHTKP